MEHEDKVNVIKFIRPNAEFVLRGDELEWLDNEQTKPSEKEISDGFVAYKTKLESDKIKEEKARAAAEAKLIKLGLTLEDLKALGF